MTPRNFGDVEPLPQESLWRGMIPLATPVMLAGNGGVGKGLVTADLVGRVTRGDAMPDGTPMDVPAGNVAVVLPEDDAETVTAWRLRAARADLGRVFDLTEGFTLPESLPALEKSIGEIGDVRLVVLDPLSAISSVHLSSGAVRIRRSITNPLESFAADTGVALLVVHHFTKDGKTVGGSKTITDAMRVVLGARRSAQRQAVRQLYVIKGNIVQDDAVMSYGITTGDYGAQVEWLDTGLADVMPEDRLRARVLAVLRESASPMSPQALAVACDAPYGAVRVALFRMARAGEVCQPTNPDDGAALRGLWTVPRLRVVEEVPN